MRHRKANRQLRRTSEQRLALLRNLATSLIEQGAIETTEAKAKELRPFVEKLITKARTGTLHARRLAGKHVHKREAADKLFQEIGPMFATRPGGYTRILKTGHRKKKTGAAAASSSGAAASSNGGPAAGARHTDTHMHIHRPRHIHRLWLRLVIRRRLRLGLLLRHLPLPMISQRRGYGSSSSSWPIQTHAE